MKYLIIFLISLLSGITSAKDSKNFCSNLDGIKQIQAYLSCQNSLEIKSCRGLGKSGRAAVLGLGGAGAYKLAKNFKNNLPKSKLQLAELLYSKKRTGRNPQNLVSEGELKKAREALDDIDNQIKKA